MEDFTICRTCDNEIDDMDQSISKNDCPSCRADLARISLDCIRYELEGIIKKRKLDFWLENKKIAATV